MPSYFLMQSLEGGLGQSPHLAWALPCISIYFLTGMQAKKIVSNLLFACWLQCNCSSVLGLAIFLPSSCTCTYVPKLFCSACDSQHLVLCPCLLNYFWCIWNPHPIVYCILESPCHDMPTPYVVWMSWVFSLFCCIWVQMFQNVFPWSTDHEWHFINSHYVNCHCTVELGIILLPIYIV